MPQVYPIHSVGRRDMIMQDNIINFKSRYDQIMDDYTTRLNQAELKANNGLPLNEEDIDILIEDMKNLSNECNVNMFNFK